MTLLLNTLPIPHLLLLTADAAPTLAAAAEGSDLIPRFLFIIAVMLIVGKVAGELFDRLGQPGVIGELLAGAILGASLFGIIPVDTATDPLAEPIAIFAEIGVLLLLFEIGLETDLKQMFRVGKSSMAVAIVGVVLPLGLGMLYWLSPVLPDAFAGNDRFTIAIFVGATLTATSVGITARVLTDLRAMSSLEAKMVIGAAVIDDILGLVLLGIVSTLAAGAAVSLLDVGVAFVLAIGFIVVAVALGFWIAPRLFNLFDAMNVRGTLLVGAFSCMLLLSAG
ncbi:MAG: cation:proton antiporter, partial [Acidimicrobiia bacterium]|nr:cation:proton antiporter [Acidimicrobiia bacterium]